MFAPANYIKLSFLVGGGSNGKGLYMQIIQKIVGKDNCSSESIKDLSSTRFTTSSLYQKTCNISSDEDFNQVVDTGLLKRLISGDRISAEFKGENRFEFYPVATMIISINNDITFNDNSYGFKRRFTIIDFPKKFSKKLGNSDIDLFEKICSKENLEYIAFKAIKYFARVLRTQEFTEPKSVQARTKEYMLNNDPVAEFLEDYPELLEVETACEDMRKLYEDWANSNNKRQFTQEQFGTQIKRFKFKTGKGKKIEGGPRKNTYIGPKYDKTKVWNPNISQCDMCKYKLMYDDFGSSPEELEELNKLDI